MKRSLSLAVIVVMLGMAVGLTHAADRRGAKLSTCKDSAQCSSRGAGCSQSVSGCSAKGGCAFATCTTDTCTSGCQIYVSGASTTMPRVLILNELGEPALFVNTPDDPAVLSFGNTKWAGFMQALRKRAPDGWSITAEVDEKDVAVTSVSTSLGAPEGNVTTVRLALEDAARIYGVAVTIDEANRKINFTRSTR